MFKKLLFFLVAFSSQNFSIAQDNESLSPDLFLEYSGSPEVVILDVRTRDEMKAGFIANAINIDYNSVEFKDKVSDLAKDKTYLVYCASGVRSGRALKVMKEMGFKKVHNLDGGIEAWKKRGFELKK